MWICVLSLLLMGQATGAENKTLVVSGPQSSGKTSLLSHAPTVAFDWFSGLCCIVYRQIGQTADSVSSSLLLRSICLQMSYAYGTDPNAIPNDYDSAWEHFTMLIQLATDSLPLVIVLDQLDSIRSTVINQDLYLMVINESLPPFVKVVISVAMQNIKKVQSENTRLLLLDPFNEERAFQYLDHMLVAKDRTLNVLQKDLVSNAISTNHDPVFIRMLINQIEKWKSSTLAKIHFTSIEEGLDKLCRNSIQDRVTASNLDAFFYAVSLDTIGIPKRVLRIFLERVFFGEEPFEIQSTLQRILTNLNCICQTKLISGLEIIALRDHIIRELLRTRVKQGDKHCKYLDTLKEIFLDLYSCCNVMEESSVEKQRLILNEMAFFRRVFLKHGTLADLKEHFMFKFDYLFAKLTCFSFAHLYDDVITATLKYPDDYELTILSEFIQLAREGLSVDSSQFPLQIIGRLNIDLLNTVNGHVHFEHSLLNQLYAGSAALCSVLKPNRSCLIAPERLVHQDKEEQSEWTTKDLKIMFFNHLEYEFVGWKTNTQELLFYSRDCSVEKAVKFEGLNRVTLAMQNELVIETKLGINVVYDFKRNETLFSIHNDYDVIGTDNIDRLVLASTDMRKIKVMDTGLGREVWFFHSESSYNNVCVASNGKIVLCFSDNRRKTPTRIRTESNTSDKSEIIQVMEDETYEEITILDLHAFCKITTISLPTEASFSKLYLASEDGLYFVRVTEPDMNILVWDLTTGEKKYEIRTRCCRIVRLAVSSVGNVIVIVSTDASIRVFNLHDGTLRHTLTECAKSARMDDQHCLSLSPDGRLCVYFVRSNFHPSFVTVWNLCNGSRLASLTTDFYGLNYLISNDSKYIVSNFPSGLVKFDLSD